MLPSIKHLFFVPALVGSFAACSPAMTADTGVTGDTGVAVDSTGTVDTGTIDDTVSMVDTGVAACNSVPITAPPVMGTAGTGTRPFGMGGTIVDGTYFLTTHATYDSPPSATTYRTVLVFTGSRLELAQTRNGGPEERATLTLTTTGTSFHTASTCPPGMSLAYDSYTATPTTITLFDVPRVVTLTRQ